MSQLQGDLDEGIGAGATLFDQALPEAIEGDDVGVDVVCQGLGHHQRAGDGRLTLRHRTRGTKTRRISPFHLGSLMYLIKEPQFLISFEDLR